MNLLSNNNYICTFYEPFTGNFYRKEQSGNFRQVQLHERRVNVIQASTGKYTWKGAGNLAWEFITCKAVPEGYLIYFKNSDKEDFRSENLGIIHKNELKALRDAMFNMQGYLRILPDKKEVYTYKVKYKSEGMIKYKSFQDCIAAKDFYNEIKTKSVRELGKYAVTQ